MITYQTGGDEPFYEQVAIVSGGFGSCGNTEFPGIYVRLEEYQVLRWIYRVAFGKRLTKPGRSSRPPQTTSKPKPETTQTSNCEYTYPKPIPNHLSSVPYWDSNPQLIKYPKDSQILFVTGTLLHSY